MEKKSARVVYREIAQLTPQKNENQDLRDKTLHEAHDLINMTNEIEENGLSATDYQLPQLTELTDEAELDQPNDSKLKQLNALLTNSITKLASDLSTGRCDPRAINIDWYMPQNETGNLQPAAIGNLIQRGEVKAYIESLYPNSVGYLRLRKALKTYKEIANKGGWAPIPWEWRFHPGERNVDKVQVLRQRLRLTHDLAPEFDNEIVFDFFDSELEDALRKFQQRHGLDPNGVLNEETIAELNVPIQERIRQIEVNLERWRWLPRGWPSHFIEVNVADFRLDVIEGTNRPLSMNVVVGQEFRRTPSFESDISQIVINPDWLVPRKLAVTDLLPILKSNPKRLLTQGFRIFDKKGRRSVEVNPLKIHWKEINEENFRFRILQSSGPTNSLGRIKFVMPNRFQIFLHDTPTKDLFSQQTRPFSSGCIRIEKPVELAEYLLSTNSKSDQVLMRRLLRDKSTKQINLVNPLPIYLLYWTSWVDEDGTVNFRKDIYGRDWLIYQALWARER